jgi:hypothetical protein
MALIQNVNVPKFDRTVINRGDAIRVRRATSNDPRNGIVTRATDDMLEILVSNIQNNATSFLQIFAGDVAIGVWEVWWTSDFSNINYNPAATAAQ